MTQAQRSALHTPNVTTRTDDHKLAKNVHVTNVRRAAVLGSDFAFVGLDIHVAVSQLSVSSKTSMLNGSSKVFVYVPLNMKLSSNVPIDWKFGKVKPKDLCHKMLKTHWDLFTFCYTLSSVNEHRERELAVTLGGVAKRYSFRVSGLAPS